MRGRLLVIAGPTGVGKTALSLELVCGVTYVRLYRVLNHLDCKVQARALGGEIVSADSVQVYRRLNIGAAKVLLVHIRLCTCVRLLSMTGSAVGAPGDTAPHDRYLGPA